MFTSSLFAALTVMALAVPLSAITQPVTTKSGLLSGVSGRDASIMVFKGVPYAAPPVGDLRWRVPKPPAAWRGVRNADKFSAACMQTIAHERKPWTYEFMAHDAISEDCLYLNIWTPAKSAGDALPVFVFIHGGGFNEGSGSIAAYDGEGLAKKGLVMITINYRLGVFGFLAHPELTKESGHHASGNYGLLDCLAALQWIRDNIVAFGGDPARVTVAGQSAGGMAVHALVASPLAKGLFRRAIVESGGSAAGGFNRELAEAEQSGIRFAEQHGAGNLTALRAMTPEQLAAPAPAPAGTPAAGRGEMAGILRFGAIIDGYLLPESIDQIVAQGKQSDMPFITGANADEGGGSPNPAIKLEVFQNQAEQRYAEQAEAFLGLYAATNDEEAGLSNNDASRDQQRMSIYDWTQARAKTSKSKVYTYFWVHALPGPDAARYGAFHTSEVPYALNTLRMSDRPFTDLDRKIADTVSSYWANFARTGNPNGKGLPEWPAVSERPNTTMQLGDVFEVIRTAGSPAKLAYWSTYFSRPHPPQPPVVIPGR